MSNLVERLYGAKHEVRSADGMSAIDDAAEEIERLQTLADANNQLARMNGRHRDAWRAKAVACMEALEAVESEIMLDGQIAEIVQSALHQARGDA